MGITAVINPAAYGKLCADVIPKVIETDAEFNRLVEKMEALDRRENPTPEEEALSVLLMKLIQDYDDRIHPLPDTPPREMILYLMEQRGLKQADLVPLFGSRSVASSVLSGKREPSKSQIRNLAEYFHLSPAVFF
jgi:HTH-type transcriptional regulator/antitoxin HigA